MAVTFAELLVPATKDEIKDLLLASLETAGFPVTSWQPGGIALLLIDAFCEALESVWQAGYFIAAGGYGATARGKWQDVWALDRFQLTRVPAASTVGQVRLTDAGGGPHVIPAGGLIVATADGKRFLSTASVTVPLNGSATVAVVAIDAGASFNVPIATVTSMVTTFPSLSVDNPAVAGSETWITTPGRDEETDGELYARCLLQWATLSVASPSGYYRAVAMAAAPTVTKVKVRDDNPNGPGTLELVLATNAGPASGGDVALVLSAVTTYRSVGAGAITVVAATASNIEISGTVYVKAANLSAARTAVSDALVAYQAELDIGDTVLAARIVKDVMNITGVRDFDPDGDVLTDVAIGESSVATLTNAITFVAE